MSVTAGALTKSQVTSDSVKVTSAAATAGTGPYAYQLHKSLDSGFSPDSESAIGGATNLVNVVSGLDASKTYYFKMVVTDTGASNAEDTSAQMAVLTAPAQNINQFAPSPLLAALDLKLGLTNVQSVQIDVSSAGGLRRGQAVKIVNSAGGVPKVVECSANSDSVFGFIVYNNKDQVFNALDLCEIAQAGSVMYLIAVAAIDRGAQVQLDISYVGGVKTKTGSSGACIVGWAEDKAASAGDLIRVNLKTPSYEVA